MNKKDIVQICEKYQLGTYTSHKFLAQGENHKNYLITTDKKYVLRTSLRNKQKQLEKEYKILKKVPKYAPKVIAHNKTSNNEEFIIQEFIEGRHPKLISKQILKQHAKQLAEIHNLTQKEKFSFDIYKHFLDNYQYWENSNIDFPSSIKEKIISKFKIYNKFFKNITKTIVHQDLVRTNIITNKGKITYIDWEWGDFRDPARDVASTYYPGFAVNPWQISLKGEREKLFIGEYKKWRKEDKYFLERIRAWQLFTMSLDYLYFIWKIKNWKKDVKSEHPKKVYLEGITKIEKYLKTL